MDSLNMTTETQLPQGWKKTTLGEIAIIKMGQSPDSKSYNKQNEGYQLIGGASDLGDKFPEPKQFTSEATKLSKINDIIICIRATIGRLNLSNKIYCLGRGVAGIEAHDKIETKFLWYVLMNSEAYLLKNSTGTTFQQVSSPTLKKLPIVYPTNKETQQAIVNKIESIFTEIDAGIVSLKTAQQQLKHYRQSLLKNAFNGELTKQWRLENTDRLPSANELLAQIQTAREQHHAEQLADWQTAVKQWEHTCKQGKKPSKPSALKTLEPISKLNEIELTELPNNWFWERLGLITLGVEYGTSAKSQSEGKVPVLRMGNMQNGKIDWTDLVYSNNDEEIEQYLLKKGDVLFNRTNSPELVGKTSIIETDEKAIFAGYLIRINHLTDIVDGRYLTYFLNSIVAKNYGNFVKTDGVNQSNINGQKLMNYPFVFCSLAEQTQIVAILENKLTACDQLACELATQLKQAELLKQAVLKSAFSGSLLDK